MNFLHLARIALFALLPTLAHAQLPGGSEILINGTPVRGGANGNCLFDNNGRVGEVACGGSSPSITVGTTTVSNGVSGRVLFDNAGILGELVVTGSGNAVLATSPTISGLTLSGSFSAPTASAFAGYLDMAAVAAPASPGAGRGFVWYDSGSQLLQVKNAGGTTSITVVPQPPVTNNFLTGISTAGAATMARPTCANLSDSGPLCSGFAVSSTTTTTAVCGAGTLTGGATVTWRFWASGKVVYYSGTFTPVFTACTVNLSAPVPFGTTANGAWVGSGYNASSGYGLAIQVNASNIIIVRYDGNFAGTTGQVYQFTGFYEIS